MLKDHKIILDKYLEKGDKVVFSDVDGTIFRDSLFLELYYYLEDKNYISKKDKNLAKKRFTDWKNRNIDYDKYLFTVVEILFKSIKGKDSSEIKRESLKRVKSSLNRTYLFTSSKIKEYQAKGYKVILISGSPSFLVKAFGKEIGINLAIGAEYFIDETSNFTGDLYQTHSTERKEEIVNYVKDTYKPSRVITFGDTNGDYGLLKLGDLAYAINPSKELFNKVKNEETIKSIIERKDLILQTNKDGSFNQINKYRID